MMKLYNKFFTSIIGLLLVVSFMASCTDKIAFGDAFLEKAPSGDVTADTVFSNAEYTKQYLNGIYALQYYGLPYNSNCGTSASPWSGKFDQLTDCWLMHWDNNTIYKAFYSGTLDATQTPLFSYTNDNVWQAVRAAWNLMEHLPKVPGLTDAQKATMKAEAQCLIAARYFDLFAVYGGLPIVDHTYTGLEGSYNLPRATVDSTVNFMTDLLDQAISSGALRWAWDGSTSETDSTNNVGRWTEAGAMALKAKILLFAASPLYNSDQGYYGGTSEAEKKHMVWYGNYDASRWTKALKACQDFFDALNKNGWYHLTTVHDVGCDKTPDGYRQAYRKGYASQGSHEILHSTRVLTTDAFKSGTYTWHQWLDAPARQNCLPTEEYVEMFPWSDGTPFNWDTDSAKGRIYGSNGRLFYQYKAVRGGVVKTASRDPRLYEECIVNGQQKSLDWTSGNSNGDVYELWVSGYDESSNAVSYDPKKNENKVTEALAARYATGYDQNKYYMNQDYLRQYCQWVYLSLDEMYLMYAECLAQTGSYSAACNMVDVVRSRVGLGSLASCNPTENLTTAAGKENLINEILRERACELGLSNNHYYDMIRYKKGSWMTEPLHGLATFRMQKNSSGMWVRDYNPWIGNDKNNGEVEPSRFDYVKFAIQNRKHFLWGANPSSQAVTKWYLWPFPQTEINKGYGLVQNPGW
jgi:hypothetical protein